MNQSRTPNNQGPVPPVAICQVLHRLVHLPQEAGAAVVAPGGEGEGEWFGERWWVGGEQQTARVSSSQNRHVRLPQKQHFC